MNLCTLYDVSEEREDGVGPGVNTTVLSAVRNTIDNRSRRIHNQ